MDRHPGSTEVDAINQAGTAQLQKAQAAALAAEATQKVLEAEAAEQAVLRKDADRQATEARAAAGRAAIQAGLCVTQERRRKAAEAEQATQKSGRHELFDKKEGTQ